MYAVTGQKAVYPPVATITLYWNLQMCQDWCADNWECMAVDYNLGSWRCIIFSSLGEIETDGSYNRYVKDCSARKYALLTGCPIGDKIRLGDFCMGGAPIQKFYI